MTSGEIDICRTIPEDRWPLDQEERSRVVEEADNSDILDRLVVFSGLYAGLKRATISHLVPDWIAVTDDGLLIELEPVECEVGSHLGKGRTSRRTSRDACHRCTGDSSGPSGVFEPEYPRTVPVREERAVDAIQQWFSLYDRLGTPGAVSYRLRALGERCGVPRLNNTTLRHTYAVMLVEKGFTREQMRRVLPMSDDYQGDGEITKYGEIVDGENPFRCLAIRHDGRQCQHWVAKGEHCRFHSGDTDLCGYAIEDGLCENDVTQSDGRCSIHSENAIRCNEPTEDGEKCSRIVSDEGDSCPVHGGSGGSVNDSEYRCGAEAATSDEPCARPVDGPDQLCPWHADEHDLRDQKFTCGAEQSRGGECEQVVDSPDARCSFHSGPVCGAELGHHREGQTCNERVSSPDARCHRHNDHDDDDDETS